MTTAKQGNNGLTKGELIAVAIFAALFGLYLLNIMVGKANIVFGWNIFHVGSLGEFLMLLIASSFNPVKVLKGQLGFGSSNLNIRKILVVVQFTLSTSSDCTM